MLAREESVLDDALSGVQSLDPPAEGPDLYRSVIELSPDAIVVHVGGVIVFINQAGLDLLRASRVEEVVGRPVFDFVHPEDRALVSGRIQAMLQTGKPLSPTEERFIALDGSELYGEARGIALTHGNAPAILSVIRDISDRKRIEQQKDAFLSLVAHEVRTPVTVIRGMLQILSKRMRDGDPEIVRRLEMVDRQAGRLVALVNELLDLSRVDSGRFECRLAPTEYGSLLQAVVEEMEMLYPGRLLYTPLQSPTWVNGDSVRLRQVLVNLVDNAVKYGPRNRPVTLAVETNGTHVTTLVSDEGPPLRVEEREHIFQRFYRSSTERRADSAGLGLGLFISREIVEAHGGRMWVVDTDRSTFAFSLPISPSA